MNNSPQPPPDHPNLLFWFNLVWIIMVILLIWGIRAQKVEFNKADISSKDYYLEYQFQHYKSGDENELQITKGEYLPAQAPPYLIRGEVHADLIDCLIYHESKGYKWAKGKAGECGILQFMPSTFQHYCVEIYGYKDNIWDEEIQRDCAAELIEDGYLRYWTTRHKCN